jgi:dGTPase
MYRAPSVMAMRHPGHAGGRGAVSVFMAAPTLLPKQWQQGCRRGADETALARIVSDYIAGMTDRFALQCHMNLFSGHAIAVRARLTRRGR